MAGSGRPTVAILQRRLVNYRVALFKALRSALDAEGIELRLVYGGASNTDKARNDAGRLGWADEVDAHWFGPKGSELVWQRYPPGLLGADLIILTQENKILSNYPLLVARALGRAKLAYWGHGRNLQAERPDSLSERFKAVLSTRIDWWFAYTEGTVEFLTSQGFPPERITCLDNAIDDDAFRADLDAVTDDDLARRRAEIDLAPGAPLGLYCGALYAEKRVDRLIEVADRIHGAIPDFRLVVVGDGPARADLERDLAARPWARCVGSQTGVDKAAWFRLATVQVSPGAVGLHVLDSFVAGVPLITADDALHGPEIDYLISGENGLILDPDPDRFADAVVELLESRGGENDRYQAMVDAGLAAAKHYTMTNMVSNFVDGITSCLAR